MVYWRVRSRLSTQGDIGLNSAPKPGAPPPAINLRKGYNGACSNAGGRRIAHLAGACLAAAWFAGNTIATAATLSRETGGFDCHLAAQIVEQQAGLPAGLLLAIGRAETGRTDPATGHSEPWAWSTNMAGIDHYFPTEAEAIDWTAAQLGGVQRSIDVGCFQINLMYHPEAFVTLEQAFDPLINARYAAQFLISLYRKTGTWQQAVEQYHSADPSRGVPYGNRVMALLDGGDAPVARVIPAGFSSRTEPSWVRIGPAVFGIQVFVPSGAKRDVQPVASSVGKPVAWSTPVPSGGVLVMMPGATAALPPNLVGLVQPTAEPRRAQGTSSARSTSTRTAARANERALPRVFTPGMAP